MVFVVCVWEHVEEQRKNEQEGAENGATGNVVNVKERIYGLGNWGRGRGWVGVEGGMAWTQNLI